jgi:hypothetical protein
MAKSGSPPLKPPIPLPAAGATAGAAAAAADGGWAAACCAALACFAGCCLGALACRWSDARWELVKGLAAAAAAAAPRGAAKAAPAAAAAADAAAAAPAAEAAALLVLAFLDFGCGWVSAAPDMAFRPFFLLPFCPTWPLPAPAFTCSCLPATIRALPGSVREGCLLMGQFMLPLPAAAAAWDCPFARGMPAAAPGLAEGSRTSHPGASLPWKLRLRLEHTSA